MAGPSPASSSPAPGGDRSLSPGSQTSGFSGSLFSPTSCSILSGSSNQRETGGLLSPSSKPDRASGWRAGRIGRGQAGSVSPFSSFPSTLWCLEPPGEPPRAPKCRQDQDQDCRPGQCLLGGMSAPWRTGCPAQGGGTNPPRKPHPGPCGHSVICAVRVRPAVLLSRPQGLPHAADPGPNLKQHAHPVSRTRPTARGGGPLGRGQPLPQVPWPVPLGTSGDPEAQSEPH